MCSPTPSQKTVLRRNSVTFAAMQLSSDQLAVILERLSIAALNPMQEASLAACQQHDEVVLLSNTGSGKTLAFLLPLLPQLQQTPKNSTTLILSPTRELALQIEAVFKSMGTGLKVTCCYGGHKVEIEENSLKQAPALLIGTAGRIADHIRRGNLQTQHITTLVIDEFDKSVELGFEETMAFIVGELPSLRKKILASATNIEPLPAFLNMQQPHVLNFVNDEQLPQEKLALQVLHCKEKDKIDSLFRLICHLGNRSTIVFCNHREAVERTAQLLKEKDILNVFYHGSIEQRDRETALCKFSNGTVNVLVTTDLASRGLDIDNIRYIVHYHLPHTEASFTHRNGRTARMDASGTVIMMLGPDEKMPAYVTTTHSNIELPATAEIPEKPKWTTLFIAAGKKDKVNKVDVVGLLTQKGQLKPEDIGLITVKDFYTFVAIRKSKASNCLHLIEQQKIKGIKAKIAIAK